jgi:hypothetical protein
MIITFGHAIYGTVEEIIITIIIIIIIIQYDSLNIWEQPKRIKIRFMEKLRAD